MEEALALRVENINVTNTYAAADAYDRGRARDGDPAPEIAPGRRIGTCKLSHLSEPPANAENISTAGP